MIVRRKIYTRIQRNLQIPNIDKKKKPMERYNLEKKYGLKKNPRKL